jgi:hypothetical protein
MKAKQYNLLNTAYAVATVWKTVTAAAPAPALQAAGAALEYLLDEIKTHGARQAEPLTGKTRERNQIFATAGEITHQIARLLLGHALAHGLADLAARVDFPESALRRGSMLSRLELMRRVHAAAIERSEPLAAFGITEDVLDDFARKIAAAEAVLTAPRMNIAKRVAATKHLSRCFRELDRLLKYTFDPLMDLQRAINPDGYVRYQAARLVIETQPKADAEVNSAAAPAATPLRSEAEKITIRDDQEPEEDERIDDEHRAVAAREVCDRGGDKREAEAEVGELPQLEGHVGKQQRQHAECLRERELDPDVVGQPQMSE